MWVRTLLGIAIIAACWLPAPVHAAPKKPAQPEDILPQSEFDDPIGLDRDSQSLGATPAERPTPTAAAASSDAIDLRYGPKLPPLDVRVGEVLSAAGSTREDSHLVTVELAAGHATINVELTFATRSRKPSELRYRLAVPEGSQLATLEVCNANGCRQGLPDSAADGLGAFDAALLARGPVTPRPLPIASARNTRDPRGQAIVLRAAPLTEQAPLTLRIRYVRPAPLHGGVVRLTLPARGMDPQAAPSELRLLAPELLDARIGNDPASDLAVSIDPWTEVRLLAQTRTGDPIRASVWQFACGRSACASAEMSGGQRSATPVDLLIALDVSPSTEGPARGRLLSTLKTLLGSLPEGSHVRALAFAGRAKTLIEQPMEPQQVTLEPFSQAINAGELGSATRFEAVWETAAPWFKRRTTRGLKPLIVIVGDGGLTTGHARPFDKARAAGVEVSVVNTADRHTLGALRDPTLRTGGVVLDVGHEAQAAARGQDTSVLRERLAALFAATLAARVTVGEGRQRVDLGPLRAGEELTWQGSARGSITLHLGQRNVTGKHAGESQRALAWATGANTSESLMPQAGTPALSAVDARDLPLGSRDWPETAPGAPSAKTPCDRRGPARRHSGVNLDAAPIAIAEERRCRPPTKAVARSTAEIGLGMPSDPLLDMLRRRILPVARGCFRRDRGGRSQYQKRAVFAFTLADREVVSAEIQGSIPDALRTCLLASVDSLEVPRFSGVVHVRYPLVTESDALPEQIQLDAQTAGNLDHMFGIADAPPSNPR
jgi:hypothetical protein